MLKLTMNRRRRHGAERSAMISSIGMDIGSNPTGVSEAFTAPFPFNGKIQRIDIETTRALRPDDELAIELEQALRTQ